MPLFVFVLVRARVPRLYSQSRYISDFLPKQYALGRHGYSLATLQAAMSSQIAMYQNTILKLRDRAEKAEKAAAAARGASQAGSPQRGRSFR